MNKLNLYAKEMRDQGFPESQISDAVKSIYEAESYPSVDKMIETIVGFEPWAQKWKDWHINGQKPEERPDNKKQNDNTN